MGKPVVHWEIASSNSEKASEFYSKLFGWKIDADNPMKYGLVNTNVPQGAGIHGGIHQVMEGMSPGVTIYVAVEDTDAYIKKAQALGGTMIRGTETIPGMVTFALIADPTGAVMGLVKDEMPKTEKAPPAAKRGAAAKKGGGAKPAPKKKASAASKGAKKKASKKKSSNKR